MMTYDEFVDEAIFFHTNCHVINSLNTMYFFAANGDEFLGSLIPLTNYHPFICHYNVRMKKALLQSL